jgi:hypothetical protein
MGRVNANGKEILNMSNKNRGRILIIFGVILINVLWFVSSPNPEDPNGVSNPLNWIGLGSVIFGIVLLVRNRK